jgi:tetratricopeptide (TPR) repeat protein
VPTLALVCVFAIVTGFAQGLEPQSRDAEWNSYKLPAVEFNRYLDPEKAVLFRVPASWEAVGSMRFRGPYDSQLQILVEKIPDGIPLKGYTNAVLQNLRSLPGGADALSVRRTEMSALEAREFLVHLPDPQGVMTRRLIWCTVSGPHAVSFVLIEPEAKAADVEPYFKAVIETAVIFESDGHSQLFEKLRSAAMQDEKPARVDEVRSLVRVITGFDSESRDKAIDALALIYKSTPDSAIELVMDRRPLVRAAAIEAVARSSNRALNGFLVQALADESADVAFRAARWLSRREDAVKLLRDDSAGWEGLQVERVMRGLALLDYDARRQIARELFNRRGGLKSKAGKGRYPVPPPPPAKELRGAAKAKRLPPPRAGRTSDSEAAPGASGLPDSSGPPAGVPGGVLLAAPGLSPMFDFALDDGLIVLGLLPDLESLSPALSIDDLIESGPAARLALTLALESRTKLPVDRLIQLLSSADGESARLAAKNLAVSASTADLPRLEEFAKSLVTVSAGKPGEKGHERSLRDELAATAKKIRWRERMASARDQSDRERIIKEGFADSDVREFAWPYVREQLEGPAPKLARPLRPPDRIALARTAIGAAEVVSPLAENILPNNVALYAAIPDAQALVDKLAGSLSGIQLETARNQANLLLMMKAVEVMLAKQFDSPVESGILESSGIKPHSPIVVGRWTAAGAPPGLPAAERKAVIVRVADRDRFEHFVSIYQQRLGHFDMLPEYVSAGARFISMLPAILPLAIQALSGETTPEPRMFAKSHHLMGSELCNGRAVTVIENRRVGPSGMLIRDTVYLTYVGDAAVAAPDWFSLRDCLLRLERKGDDLSSNPEFMLAARGGGDVIYLSDPVALFGAPTTENKARVTERGALRIRESSWESSFEVGLGGADWRGLNRFRPVELTSPALLLPKDSLAYLFMNLDVTAAWRGFVHDLLGSKTAQEIGSIWEIDFEREVLPDLGPECGAALLGLPSPKDGDFDPPWVVFFQIRSDRLARAFAEGKLVKNEKAGEKAARVRIGNGDYWVAVKNGFLVIAGSEAAIDKLDSAEHLNTAKDFGRAARNATGEVIAFGGTNIEAATNSVKVDTNDQMIAQAMGTMLSLARAFHSHNLTATLNDDVLAARMSVSLDREGRFSVADLAALSKDFQFAAAEVEARGIPISDQAHIDSLKLKISSRANGAAGRIAEDIRSKTQLVEKTSESELIVTIQPRRPAISTKVVIPVTAAELEPFLRPTKEIRSTDPTVVAQAREIAGEDHDGWSVARKLSDWTFKNLKWKRVDDADAAQTLATREADCLEFSQLFVAMARAVGLPARIVAGMAHGGGSFGGHAWVEVWVGDWVELDPTWGTNFVDATHIRSSAFDLGAYAALNLIGMEVLEARRGIAQFQRDPARLVEALLRNPDDSQVDAWSAALDPEILVDGLREPGTWAGMSPAERNQVYSSFRRLVAELPSTFVDQVDWGAGPRVLKVRNLGDSAEALVIQGFGEMLVRIQLVRRGEAWFLREMTFDDLCYGNIVETLRPTLRVLEAKRKGVPAPTIVNSPESRILLARQTDVKQALQVADEALRTTPDSQPVRFLKALCLLQLPGDTDAAARRTEAVRLLSSLTSEGAGFAPALRELGDQYARAGEDDPDRKSKQEEAIALLRRYASLIPEDPRPHETLAELYETRGEPGPAEAAYRKAIELDPLDPNRYASLAAFLVTQSRFADALHAIDQSKGRGQSKDAMVATLFYAAADDDAAVERVEALAAAAPDTLAKNVQANLNLAYVRIISGRSADALPLLRRAANLDPKNAAPHCLKADAYRRLRNWVAALRSADEAIRLDDKNAEAQFHRACALAQLHRPGAAVAALRKAVELDEDLDFTDDLEGEPDLKPISKLPEFKKLIEDLNAGQDESKTPAKKN